MCEACRDAPNSDKRRSRIKLLCEKLDTDKTLSEEEFLEAIETIEQEGLESITSYSSFMACLGKKYLDQGRQEDLERVLRKMKRVESFQENREAYVYLAQAIMRARSQSHTTSPVA